MHKRRKKIIKILEMYIILTLMSMVFEAYYNKEKLDTLSIIISSAIAAILLTAWYEYLFWMIKKKK